MSEASFLLAGTSHHHAERWQYFPLSLSHKQTWKHILSPSCRSAGIRARRNPIYFSLVITSLPNTAFLQPLTGHHGSRLRGRGLHPGSRAREGKRSRSHAGHRAHMLIPASSRLCASVQVTHQRVFQSTVPSCLGPRDGGTREIRGMDTARHSSSTQACSPGTRPH